MKSVLKAYRRSLWGPKRHNASFVVIRSEHKQSKTVCQSRINDYAGENNVKCLCLWWGFMDPCKSFIHKSACAKSTLIKKKQKTADLTSIKNSLLLCQCWSRSILSTWGSPAETDQTDYEHKWTHPRCGKKHVAAMCHDEQSRAFHAHVFQTTFQSRLY